MNACRHPFVESFGRTLERPVWLHHELPGDKSFGVPKALLNLLSDLLDA